MGQQIQDIEPRIGLLNDTLVRVHAQHTRTHARKQILVLSVFLMCTILLFGGVVYIAQLVFLEVQSSGFTIFLSLIVTDSRMVLEHWQEFSYSLLETVPSVTLIMLFAMILAFLVTLRKSIHSSYKLFSTLRT